MASSAPPCWSAAAKPIGTGRSCRWPVDGDQAGIGLDQQVLAGPRGHRPGAAEAGRRGVDDVGPDRLDLLVAEAQALHRAGPKVLHQHVGALEQAQDHRLAVRVLEVDGDPALVAVGRKVEGGEPVDKGLGAGPVALEGAARRLDLDHVGAHVGEILRPCRALQVVAEADDAHAFEHGCLLSLCRRVYWIAASVSRSKKCSRLGMQDEAHVLARARACARGRSG